MSEKLISADDLIQFVKHWGELRGREEAADSFLYAINNAPAVDAVEVVRCEKCKYWEPMNNGSWMNRNRTDGVCRTLMEFRLAERYMTNKDHFCSLGKRRDENGES